MTTLRLGTRASDLARTQSATIADALAERWGVEVELVTISSQGDQSTAPLRSFGGVGVFVAALREAVVSGEVDFAVHSLKDMPTAPDPRLTVAAVTVREDPRDALVARDGLTLTQLPAGSRVGTGSPRRQAQLNALGLGLEVVELRGNVPTRLAKVTDGELDAVVVAAAGLARLGRINDATELLDPQLMLPAPGQGALALECRLDDAETAALLAPLDDPPTRAAVTAERTLLAALEAGCSAPVGALADIAESDTGDAGDEIYLRGVVADVSGSPSIRLSATGTEPVAVGEQLAAELLANGANALMAEPARN